MMKPGRKKALRETAWGIWGFIAMLLVAVLMAFDDWLPELPERWANLEWSLSLLFFLAQGAFIAFVVLFALGAFVVTVVKSISFFTSGKRGRHAGISLCLFAAAFVVLLAQTTAPRLEAMGLALLLAGLGVWQLHCFDKRSQGSFDLGWAVRTFSWPALLLFFIVFEIMTFFLGDFHAWQFDKTHSYTMGDVYKAMGVELEAQPPTAPQGRIALIIPKHVVRRPFYIYVDKTILGRRDYQVNVPVVHRTESGSYMYDQDGELLGKRTKGKYVFIPKLAGFRAEKKGIYYEPSNPLMGQTDLFEILIIKADVGEHLIELVSFLDDYDLFPDSPYVSWGRHPITVEEQHSTELVAFQGLEMNHYAAVAAQAAKPIALSVDDRMAQRRQDSQVFEALLRDHPLIQSFISETERMQHQDDWVFSFPEKYGGQREYTHNQINNMSTWLYRMMKARKPSLE